MHQFHPKLLYQKPVLRQIGWWVQNGPITKNEVLPVTASFFWKESLIKSWFDVPTTQMCIFVLFVSAGVLFDGAFSLRVSLSIKLKHFVNKLYMCLQFSH